MVRLVIDGQDVPHAHQFGHHALQHLSLGFQRVEGLAAALKQRSAAPGQLDTLAPFEGVVIGDNDAGALHIGQQLGRRQLAASVVAVRVVRLEHAQAVAYGQTRRHDQKTARKSFALRMTHGIDGLPRDQHRHHRGFAGAGGEL